MTGTQFFQQQRLTRDLIADLVGVRDHAARLCARSVRRQQLCTWGILSVSYTQRATHWARRYERCSELLELLTLGESFPSQSQNME